MKSAEVNGVFVHGLWGERGKSKYPTRGHGSARTAVRRSKHAPYPLDPLLVYVWGRDNAKYLRTKGFNPILIARSPIHNYSKQDVPRNPIGDGQINWGLSMWRHKLEAMHRALNSYPAIVWLDWDIYQVAPLPSDFWARLAKGQPIQGSLRQYKCPQCLWREEEWQPRLVPHGAWFYCREQGLVRRAIEMHTEICAGSTDEVAWAAVIDEMLDGWKGPEEYKRLGFEPYCYDQRKTWRQLYPPKPEDVIFLNQGKY